MFDLLKKSLLAGIGAVVVTKDKIQEATRTLVQEGKISTEEAEKLAEEMIKSGARQWDELSTGISEAMKRWMESTDMVSKKDFQNLRARVEMLDQRVAVLEEAHRREKGVLGEY